MTIALYHFHVTQIKRSAGQSAVAAAAYRSGEKLHSEYYGEDSDYTRKGGVICSEILLPSHAPSEYADRETLWNAVEKVERGKKAQLAYSFDIALQNEFSMEENIELARQFLLDNFVSRGMVVDFAENQAVFYGTHPAIIEQEVFDKVQEIRRQRHRRTKTGKSSLFSGMVYCADCGAKMRYCTTNYFEKRQDHFVCANYRSNTGSCSAHFIRAVVLEDLVWMHMKTVIFYVTRYEKHFRAIMEQKLRLSSEEAIHGCRKRLTQAEKRLGELDRLFIRIYEDNVAGCITDERFSMMSRTYEDEQTQLKVEILSLQQEIEVQARQIENLEQFIQRVHKYEDLDELTPYALRELVKAIYIEAPDRSSGKRRQSIRISYDLVGFIPVEELMKQETA